MMVGEQIAGLLIPISKTSVTTYTLPFITVNRIEEIHAVLVILVCHVEKKDERELVLVLSWTELMCERLFSLGCYCLNRLSSLDSPSFTGQGWDLAGHGKRFVTLSSNSIVVHSNEPRSFIHVSVWISNSVCGS